MKKMISVIMSAMLAMSATAAMNSSAVLIREPSEQYNSIIEKYNKSCTPAPELADIFNDIFPDLNVKNVWLRNGSTSQCSSYVIECAEKDMLSFKPLPEERDTIINELKSKLGYEDETEIIGSLYDDYDDGFIRIRFVGEDHELNYMIAEKAYSLVKDKYKIERVGLGIGYREYRFREVQNYFSSIDGYKSGDEEYDKLKREIYDSTDNEMLKEKYKASITEIGDIEFYEGFTETDKFECFKYFAENYNACIYATSNVEGIYDDTLASDLSASTMKAAFDEINYLDGDANCDSICSIADAAMVLQSLGNPDKYGMSRQGSFNADLAGDGLTTTDALAIQKKLTEPYEK